MSGPFVLVPIEITDAMVISSTIAEPVAAETLWNAATNYNIGTQAIRLETHRIYENLIAGVNATFPEDDPTRWLDTGATERWKVLDTLTSTQSSVVTPMEYVLQPGLFNSFAAFGVEASSLRLSIKDMPGGTVFFDQTFDPVAPPIDYWDYYFGQILAVTTIVISDILPQINPEVTITLTALAGTQVKAGMFIFGDMRSVIGEDAVGGTLYNAKVKPTTTSLFVSDGFGGTRIIRRTKATDMDIDVYMTQPFADSALQLLQEVLDIPAVWVGSNIPGFTGLTVFGLASGEVSYDGPNHATMQISVRGLV